MTRPGASLTQARLREALVAVLDRVLPTCPEVDYCLVGTGAALLHGVDLPAADVDLLARGRHDMDAFAAGLSSFPCLDAAAWLPEARQYYCKYDVNGVEVGISTVGPGLFRACARRRLQDPESPGRPACVARVTPEEPVCAVTCDRRARPGLRPKRLAHFKRRTAAWTGVVAGLAGRGVDGVNARAVRLLDLELE